MYNKALNVWSLGKLVSFVLPGILMFPTNIGTIGKTKTVSPGNIHQLYTLGVYHWTIRVSIGVKSFIQEISNVQI